MAHTIVIFGASGDLTARKLIPALFELFRKGRLPQDTRVVGVSRREKTDEQWRDELAASTTEFLGRPKDGDLQDEELWREFAASVHYCPGDVGSTDDLTRLRERLDQIEAGGVDVTRVYYLSIAPKLYPSAVAMLGEVGLADQSNGPRRLVIEKPFGTNLATARSLNDDIHKVFDEKHVYRIDHYLGKETVQNVLVLRFANAIFEPLWNRTFIDHVQITAAESVGVGHRAGYYDGVGVLRDMFQNHLLQLMTLTAMEAPSRFQADAIRDEKVKVLRAIRPIPCGGFADATLRGQYDGYRGEPDVGPESETATFAAVRLCIDNWRWQGVPFYLRSGKAMSCRTTQIVIQFREPPHMLFESGPRSPIHSNRLVIQVQPDEGIQLHFHSKVPDRGLNLLQTELGFRFAEAFQGEMPEAYQRLLLDVMQGDASLFSRSDEVETAWSLFDPILAAWEEGKGPPIDFYQPGFWGPERSTQWMAEQGREWFDACPMLK